MTHRMHTTLLLVAATLSLASCKRTRTPPVEITRALGTEPFWGVDVRSDRILLTRVGADSAVYPYAPATIDTTTGRAIYRTKRFGVDPLLVLVIDRGDCSDGMSDTRYPAMAALSVGDSTWRGCATVAPAK
jgi:uncharacterized membrane protein